MLLAGCSGAFGATNRHVSRAALATSTLTLVCDGMQTLRMSQQGWAGHMENNPVMGERPTAAIVGAYFVGVVALNATAWLLTPERYRAPLPVAVTAAQTLQIQRNASAGTGVCGF
jgi:hypothetical protein